MVYRTCYCDDCGLEAPQNEMHRWTRQVETGRESDTTQTFANGATGFRAGKVTYKTEHLLICQDCYDKIQAELERQRQEERAHLEREERFRQMHLEHERRAGRRNLGIALGVGLILVGWITWAATHSSHANSPAIEPSDTGFPSGEISAGAAPSPASEDAATSAAAETPALSVGSDSAAVGSTSASGSQADDTSSSPSAGPTAEGAAQQAAQTYDLRSAIATALSTGRTIPWTDGQSSGAVVVGPIAPWRGRSCRTYGYSINGVRAPLKIMCQTFQGGWWPEN